MEGIADHVAGCLQLAILLEVSAPKPGNVNLAAHFPNTRYEHFLASAVAVEPSFREAAIQGMKYQEKKIEPSQTSLGRIIRTAIVRVNTWQRGGNTLLGAMILLSPIAVAAGIALADRETLRLPELRANINSVVKSTTPADAVAFYEAINLANPNGLVGKAPTLDVNDPESRKRIVKEGITLYDILRISAAYDSISGELVENYPLTFDVGYPYLSEQLRKKSNLNEAIVHTFLKVLSVKPDTLVVRKAGIKKAEEISEKAREVLDLGGLRTNPGSRAATSLDRELRRQGNQLNPGTTADVISAILAVSILNGYRP